MFLSGYNKGDWLCYQCKDVILSVQYISQISETHIIVEKKVNGVASQMQVPLDDCFFLTSSEYITYK